MSKSSTLESRLKRLSKEIPDEMEVIKQLRSLEGDNTHSSDRAAAIIGASLLESALETVILSKLMPISKTVRTDIFDDAHGAPLATFSSRIIFGYALGIYGQKTKSQLGKIRIIRNAFAHSGRELKFSTEEVKEVADQLTLYKGKSLSGTHNVKSPKEKYITNVAFIAAKLKAAVIPPNVLELARIQASWTRLLP